jgi:hypothetical protein
MMSPALAARFAFQTQRIAQGEASQVLSPAQGQALQSETNAILGEVAAGVINGQQANQMFNLQSEAIYGAKHPGALGRSGGDDASLRGRFSAQQQRITQGLLNGELMPEQAQALRQQTHAIRMELQSGAITPDQAAQQLN